MATAKHRFEDANLGKPPYKYLGVDKMPNGCQYCGTYIVRRFHLESADGKRFWVGCECILRKGDDPAHYVQPLNVLEKMVKEAKAKIAKELKDARDEVTLKDLNAIMAPDSPQAAKLQQIPHPYSYYAKNGKTYFDYANNSFNWSYTSGKLKLYNNIRVALEGNDFRKGEAPPKVKKERKAKKEVDNLIKTVRMGLVPKQQKQEKSMKRDQKWENNFSNLQAFVQECGKLPNLLSEVPEEKKVGVWCNNQRQALRKGKLSQERQEKLNNLTSWYWKKNKKNVTE